LRSDDLVEATRQIFPTLSNNLDIAHLKKSEHLESNVLKHYLVKTKAFGGYPMECLQMILEEV